MKNNDFYVAVTSELYQCGWDSVLLNPSILPFERRGEEVGTVGGILHTL